MKHHRLAGGLLTALVFAVIGAPQAVAAQVDYFLKLDPITAGHEEIHIESFSWGLSNPGSQHTGGGGGAGKVNVQDLSLTKWVDKSSPLLMLAVAKGQHFPCAILTARKDGQQSFLVFRMERILISSYQTGGSAGDDTPTDNFSLNFTKITFEHSSQKDSGERGTTTSARWDFLTRKQFDTSSGC